MQKNQIDYSQTGYFSNLVLDYLAQKDTVKPFYHYPPSLKSVSQITTDLQQKEFHRTTLVEILNRQYTGFEVSESSQFNINSLLNSDTFTIVTGHQPCLFTGPLYFLYKIISAINLSKQLNELYPTKHFVPVYWIGSDDHDFEEINHIRLFGKTITWHQPVRTATGRLSTNTLQPVFDELKTLVGEGKNSEELLQLLEKAYLQHKTLAQATRYLVNELFGQYGLVIIDQDDAQLKGLFAPTIKQELLEAKSYRLVQDANTQLQQFGYVNQAFPRPINLFYLTDDFRERIERTDDTYTVNQTGITFTEAEILQELETHPERFSPNVILRPVYQQTVLPSVAYIGGGGELAYWLQLASVFQHYGVNYPMLILRNSVLWIDASNVAKIKAIPLNPQDLFTEVETLVADYVTSNSQHTLNLSEQKELAKQLFDQIQQQVLAIDPTLQASVLAEAAKVNNGIDNLEAKILKAEKRKFDTTVQQIRSMKARFFPNNSLQERHDNFIPYYLQYGKEFITHLVEALDPLDFRFTILQAENKSLEK